MRTYATDLTEAQWALVGTMIPEGKPGGRPRSIDVRAVVNAIFYLLRTGCQWRLLPREFPPWPTVYYYFRRWEQESVWLTLLRSLYPLTRLKAGRRATPSIAIMDGQSVKTTEKGAFEVVGLTWIVERTFAWIGRYRRMSKDYEHRVQTSETLIDLIAIRLMLNRLP